MIAVHQLRKSFQGPSQSRVVAVDGLSFTVSPGEIYGLLGPNGAGKTTTLKMLTTLLKPDSGTVEVDGIDALRSPLAVRERLAYVPAEAGLPERLTGREVVTLFAKIQGVERAEEKAKSVLSRLGAESYWDQPCEGLSTGMKRRIVLARALIHEPSVLLLDEPTDGLDVQGRRDVLGLVQDEARRGRTIVLSSHIMGEVQQVVHRIGIVSKGRLAAEGTIEEVLRQSQQPTLDDAFLRYTTP